MFAWVGLVDSMGRGRGGRRHGSQTRINKSRFQSSTARLEQRAVSDATQLGLHTITMSNTFAHHQLSCGFVQHSCHDLPFVATLSSLP